MKTITVVEYLKFQELKKDFAYDNAYRSGYWNVFKYTPELEQFLKSNNVQYTVNE